MIIGKMAELVMALASGLENKNTCSRKDASGAILVGSNPTLVSSFLHF